MFPEPKFVCWAVLEEKWLKIPLASVEDLNSQDKLRLFWLQKEASHHSNK